MDSILAREVGEASLHTEASLLVLRVDFGRGRQ
jgi:hypothetical protein